MSEWSYIGAAYGITWVVLIGYAVRLARVTRRAERVHEAAVRTRGVPR